MKKVGYCKQTLGHFYALLSQIGNLETNLLILARTLRLNFDYVTTIINTAHNFRNMGLNMYNVSALLVPGLPDEYKHMVMRLESSEELDETYYPYRPTGSTDS